MHNSVPLWFSPDYPPTIYHLFNGGYYLVRFNFHPVVFSRGQRGEVGVAEFFPQYVTPSNGGGGENTTGWKLNLTR